MGLVILDSEYGEVVFDLDIPNEEAWRDPRWEGLTPKGGVADVNGPVLKGKFSDAMNTLGAFSKSVQAKFHELETKPSEVKVNIGLKFSASSGFVIAKAGGETVIGVTLTWSPDKS